MDENSDTYIGENPVEIIEANILEESVTIVVNPDRVAEDRSNVPDETSVNGVAVEIRYGKMELISCTLEEHDGECRPIVGGVSVSDQNKAPDLNTIAYKAIRNGATGFVVAGHTTDSL